MKHWPDELGPAGPAIPSPAPLVALANQVANAYRGSQEAEQRRQLAEAFLLIADHLQDQGQTLDPNCVVEMREVLGRRDGSIPTWTPFFMPAAATTSSSRAMRRFAPTWISTPITPGA